MLIGLADSIAWDLQAVWDLQELILIWKITVFLLVNNKDEAFAQF